MYCYAMLCNAMSLSVLFATLGLSFGIVDDKLRAWRDTKLYVFLAQLVYYIVLEVRDHITSHRITFHYTPFHFIPFHSFPFHFIHILHSIARAPPPQAAGHAGRPDAAVSVSRAGLASGMPRAAHAVQCGRAHALRHGD